MVSFYDALVLLMSIMYHLTKESLIQNFHVFAIQQMIFVSCITGNFDLSNHSNIQVLRLFKLSLFNLFIVIKILTCICFLIPQH